MHSSGLVRTSRTPRIGAVLAAAALVSGMTACVQTPEERHAAVLAQHCGLEQGQLIQTTLDQRRGMVVDYGFGDDSVYIRFGTRDPPESETQLVGDPYYIVKMRCFEVEASSETSIEAPAQA